MIQRAEKRRKRKEKLEKAKKDAQDSNSENDENDPSTNWLKAGARRKRTVSHYILSFITYQMDKSSIIYSINSL